MLKQRILKFRFNFVWLVCFLTAIFTATASNLQAKTTAVQQGAKSCLWTVTAPSNKIYLLGSLHVLKQDSYPLADAIESAYTNSRVIIFETDIAAMQKPGMQTRLLELGLYPADQNLLQHLDGDTRQLLGKKLDEVGLSLEQFSQFKPWFAALTLTTLELQRLGYNPAYGVDIYFFNRATSDGKEIDYLEPAEYQINLLGTMAEEDQKNFLSQTLKDLEVVKELAADLVRSWKDGDADKLHELLYKSFKDYPELHDRLLIQRNKSWIKKIKSVMRTNKNVLIVVGAGHLVGPDSVIDLLRKQGYEVNQQ